MRQLLIETALGTVRIALALDAAPATAGYFLDEIDRGSLDGGSIFRVLSSALGSAGHGVSIDAVQFGTARGLQAPRRHIPHEHTRLTGLCHEAWTVSAARFSPGEVYGSFFVCTQEEPSLDYGGARHPDGEGFAAFGTVIEGHGVIAQAHALAEAGGFLSQPVAIRSARVVDDAPVARTGA